jgi:hypothetical protein
MIGDTAPFNQQDVGEADLDTDGSLVDLAGAAKPFVGGFFREIKQLLEWHFLVTPMDYLVL